MTVQQRTLESLEIIRYAFFLMNYIIDSCTRMCVHMSLIVFAL